MPLSSDSTAEFNLLTDPSTGIEMAPWITFSSLGISGVVAVVEQSPAIGWVAIVAAIVNIVYEKHNRQKEKAERNEVAKLTGRLSAIETKLDTILLVDSQASRQGLLRVPRGDGADTDS